jgi:lauroyl/myristoyl acyltransferase
MAKWLPLGMTRFFAGWAGNLYARGHPERVAVVRRNLQLLHADVPAKTARRVYADFGRTLADYFYIGTRPVGEAARIIADESGRGHLDKIHREGTGAVIVAAHFGLFELGGLLMAHQGFPSVALTYPEPSAELTAWRARFRKRWNVETIEIGTDRFAFLKIADRLRAGCFVAALIDRPHPTESVPVSLPNGTANFSTGILLLAAHCGAPIVPATMVRRPDGFYQARVFPPLYIVARSSREETLRYYSQQIADIFAPVLCEHPEQWYQFVPLSPAS